MAPDRLKELDYRTVLIPIAGKLRGSQARLLEAAVERLRDDGYDQIVLDLRACPSLDTLGALALRRAVDLGHRLFLVLGAGFALDDFLADGLAAHPRVRLYGRLEDAIQAVRSREQSGALVA